MGLFDTTTTTNTKQKADQSYGLSDEINQYAGSIGGIYNPSNYAGAWAGINPYQAAAAANQQGLSAGLTPAYNQALSIGATGIDPNRIAAFQSPYTDQVVRATQDDFDQSNSLARARDQSWAVKQGASALGGTQLAANRRLGDFSRERAQAPVIAGLRNQGFQTAAGLAGQSAGLQLSGLGAAGTLSGAQSGLNQGLYQMGSGLQQLYQYGNLLPYQLATQGAQTYAGMAPASGQHTSGTSSGTSTSSPSIGSIGAGLIGAGLSAWSDARIKDNIKVIGETYDGQPIYKYNFKGSPKTEIGLMAQDVEQRDPDAVSESNGIKMVDYDRATEGAERKADGGGVMAPYAGNSDAKDPHSRLMKAFHSIRGMMRSNGGPVIKPFADGGDVGGLSSMFLPQSNIMDKVPNAAKALTSAGANMQKQADDANSKALSGQQSGLSQMMSGMMGGAKGFADGGSPRVDFGRKIYDFFVAQGLPPHQAAAVAGNMAWEGGGRADLVNPGDNWRNSPRAPHSIGIAQWNDRSPALIEYAKSQGIDIPDGDLRDKRYAQDVIRRIPLEEQLKFAWNEMHGPERRAYDRITRADDLYAGTAAATGYHRPAGWTPSNPYGAHGLAGRYDLARKILNSTSGGDLGETPASSNLAPFSTSPQPPDGMDAASYAPKSVIPAFAAAGSASLGNPVDAAIKPYSAVDAGSPSTPPTDPAKEKSFGDTIKSFGSKLSDLAKPQENVGAKALAEQQSSLSRMLAGMMLPAKGFADGGSPSRDIEWVDGQPVFPSSSDAGPSYAGGPKETDLTSREPGVTISPLTPSSVASRGPIGGAPPVEKPSALSGFNWKSLMPFQGGVWNGEAMTPMQRAGAALMQIGNGPFAGMGNAVLEMNKHRLEQQKENRALAALMGRREDGTPTFEAQEKSGLIPLNGKMVPTLDKQKLDETSRLHNANIGLLEKQTQNEGIKVNPVTSEYYSADPKSPFYPQVGTPDPNAGMAAAVRKAWATKVAPEQLQKLSDAYNTANDTVNKFNDIEALLPKMVTGKWAATELEGRKLLRRFGYGDADKVAATEIGRALTQTLILDATKDLKPASNLDLTFTKAATTNIENTPETLAVLLPGLRAAAQRSQLKAELERREVLEGRIPDTVAIDKSVDATIPSPIQKYGHLLGLDKSGERPALTTSASSRSAPAVAPIEPPQGAVNLLLENQKNPKAIEDFNMTFNGGKPGLAESKISEATASSQPADKSPKEYDPHNLIRRFFGYDPT